MSNISIYLCWSFLICLYPIPLLVQYLIYLKILIWKRFRNQRETVFIQLLRYCVLFLRYWRSFRILISKAIPSVIDNLWRNIFFIVIIIFLLIFAILIFGYDIQIYKPNINPISSIWYLSESSDINLRGMLSTLSSKRLF